MSRDELSVDVAIVGAGTAGLSALREVRRRTESFVLVNDPPYGTTCARVGCMPSKALIAAANAMHTRARLGEFGIRGGQALEADIPAALRRVRALRDHFVAGVLEATDDLGERNIAGRARLEGPDRLVVGGRVIRARQVILAPGSSPIVPEEWRAFGDRVLTTDTLFEQEDLPRRIGVVGLGAIGVEVAQALARLGLDVQGFEGAPHVAGIADEGIAAAMRDWLCEEFPVHLDAQVDLREADGDLEIRWRGRSVVVDKVVVAVGRRPNIAGLGLETLGVPLDERGMPEVDATTMRIGETQVLLAGDANGRRPLLHEAADDGHIAGINATSDEPVRLARRTLLGIVFCDPEVATVGQRPEELEPHEFLRGEVDFASQGRARTMQENRGRLHVYAAPTDGRLLGAEIAAPAAEHMAHLLALAVSQRLTVHDLLRMPTYHPTLEEGLRTALRAIARHLPPCSISDLAECGSLGAEALE
ncbi:dihydrolipoyl dehydrogenase [Roseitranquillus sediminis]|uniref:dihydrolipoyl dehydrogenase n=1 Tax=Roseitranquillus sediminis TaxID=2809051 RepID=UPI001D0C2D35|nr:dihydrolipoyl dehydrogenase [Roseitranquillus sediminis]MBM9594237.1 dihydrolipoyl dehydrogenase [Roseitranquillus sediminis]